MVNLIRVLFLSLAGIMVTCLGSNILLLLAKSMFSASVSSVLFLCVLYFCLMPVDRSCVMVFLLCSTVASPFRVRK